LTRPALHPENERTELSLATTVASPNPQEPDESIDFARWINGILKRWWIVLIAGVVATGATTLYALQLPKLYQTSATVLIERNTPNVLSGVDELVPVSGGSWWSGQDFYQHAYLVLKSRQVAGRAAELLGPEFFGGTLAEDPSTPMFGTYTIAADPNAPGVVRIRVVKTDPERATKMANAVARAYEELNLEGRVQGTKDAGTWLSLQHRDLKTKLEGSEDALYRFMEDNDVLNASLDTQLEEVKQRLSAFNAQLAGVQGELIQSQVDAEALREAKENPALVDTLEQIQGVNLISGLKARITDLRAAQSELSGRYQPKHPRMVALGDQILGLQGELQREINARIVALERAQRSLRESERGLRAAIAQERSREARMNRLGLEFKRLEREVSTNEKLFDMVTSRMKEADLSGAMRFNNVRVLDEARVPGSPFKPSVRRYVTMGLLIGLFLGVAIAILLELLDNTIKSHQDLEQTLNLTFLGLVPIITADDGRVRDTYVMEHPKSMAAESVRFIRTNLMFMSSERPLHTMTVTSALPQDGKTTTAMSLAITMAQAGSRTLLVDTDMRRPRIHRVFDFDNARGLSSVLVGEAKLDDVIQKTALDDFDVLVCGPTPPNPAELLHTRRFLDLVEELKKRYDRVIFDSSPCMAVTDPVVLGSITDGTVVVMRAGETSRDAVKQALRVLRDAKVHLLGGILNTADMQRKGYYGRGGYRYSRYPAEDEDPAAS
jgi:capsular exopolysaccharide synthesis family protein